MTDNLIDERDAEIARLRKALIAVRVKAIPAGAAVGLRREGWETRCTEVLDIIDEALLEQIYSGVSHE